MISKIVAWYQAGQLSKAEAERALENFALLENE